MNWPIYSYTMWLLQLISFYYFLPQAFAELNQITDQTILDNKVTDYNKEVSELWDKLMGLELQLVDQLEVIFC